MPRSRSKVFNVTVEGPLAPFADDYKARLEKSGYTPLTTMMELRQMAQLSRWMEFERVSVRELAPAHVDEFVVARRAAMGVGNASRRALTALLELLVDRGAVPPAALVDVPPSSRHGATLARFETYLLAERGLADCTTQAYLARVRRFVTEHAADRRLGDLCAADVVNAVQAEAARVSVGSTQYFIAGLRAFLRFCFLDGLTAIDLSAAALAVTGRRHSLLPRGIGRAEAQALLESCDRRRAGGRRDHAVLVVLLRLGLRASELAGLSLDDIDWRAGEVVVRGKGRREDRLPLPVDVGESIAGYLRRGRPSTTCRELFVRQLAPAGPLGRGGVSSIVRRACRRAGVEVVGAHRLRHTLACELVTSGVALRDIAGVLRHRDVDSAATYARVDLDALRSVAPPWPGGDRS